MVNAVAELRSISTKESSSLTSKSWRLDLFFFLVGTCITDSASGCFVTHSVVVIIAYKELLQPAFFSYSSSSGLNKLVVTHFITLALCKVLFVRFLGW